MVQASGKGTVHALADPIWQVFSDFEAACQYLGTIRNCMVEGQGFGALRTLTRDVPAFSFAVASQQWAAFVDSLW